MSEAAGKQAEAARVISRFFKISTRSVRTWFKNGLPNDAEGIFRWLRGQAVESKSETVRRLIADPRAVGQLRVVLNEKPPAVEEIPDAEERTENKALPMDEAKRLKTYWEMRRQETAYHREVGEVCSKASIREAAQSICAAFSDELKAMLGDLPGQLAGVDEAEVQERLKARFGTAFGNLERALMAL
jgi:hypothetical protein